MVPDTETLKVVNRSGLPFQLRVQDEVARTQGKHGWRVLNREHPWRHPHSTANGYIDIVLEHSQFVTFRLVIECKRMKSDDLRQLTWAFLAPEAEFDNSRDGSRVASCLEVEGRMVTEELGKRWKDIRMWDDVNLAPRSLESQFCVLPSDDGKRTPILESLASEVLESVEGLAEEEVNVSRSQDGNQHVRLFMFPAIVTNAELAVCRFKTRDVDLQSGTIADDLAEFERVPFIRFRKSLATRFPLGSYSTIRGAAKARERTVFVVNANSISTFLTNWEMSPLSDMGYAIERHQL